MHSCSKEFIWKSQEISNYSNEHWVTRKRTKDGGNRVFLSCWRNYFQNCCIILTVCRLPICAHHLTNAVPNLNQNNGNVSNYAHRKKSRVRSWNYCWDVFFQCQNLFVISFCRRCGETNKSGFCRAFFLLPRCTLVAARKLSSQIARRFFFFFPAVWMKLEATLQLMRKGTKILDWKAI